MITDGLQSFQIYETQNLPVEKSQYIRGNFRTFKLR